MLSEFQLMVVGCRYYANIQARQKQIIIVLMWFKLKLKCCFMALKTLLRSVFITIIHLKIYLNVRRKKSQIHDTHNMDIQYVLCSLSSFIISIFEYRMAVWSIKQIGHLEFSIFHLEFLDLSTCKSNQFVMIAYTAQSVNNH